MISQVTRPLNHSKKKNRAKPINQKEKEKGQNPGCYKPSPHKEISSSRFGCSGNKYDLSTPPPTWVSFFLYLLFPQEFQMINLPCSVVVLLHLSPNSDGFLLTYQILFIDVKFLISTVISTGSEHTFSFDHENLFYFCHGVASDKCRPSGFNKC